MVEHGRGNRDPPLDLANAGQVLIQLAAVCNAEILREAPGLFQDEVENALLPPSGPGTGLRLSFSAGAPKSRSNNNRGLTCFASGARSLRHARFDWYAQL